MHDQKTLLENRLTRFVAEYLEPALYRSTAPVDLTWWRAPDEPVPFAEAVAQSFEPIQVGLPWGRPWSTTWIHVTGTVPQDWRSGGRLPPDTRVELVVDLGFDDQPGFQAEGLAWTPDGVIVKAVSPYNNHVPVDPEAPVDLYLEAAANPDVSGTRQLNGLRLYSPTPYGDPATAGDDLIYELRQLRARSARPAGVASARRDRHPRWADAGAAGDPAAPGGDPAGSAADAGRRGPREHRRQRGAPRGRSWWTC